MENFSKNVFINCPFDDDYRNLLICVIFTVKYLNFTPKLSFETSDAGTARLENIITLIESSKFGIHDLSRLLASKKGEHLRMNMPFELGLDIGCKKYKNGTYSEKKTLVLEKERYRFMKSLSDLSGSDIASHDDEPTKIIKVVRDWFVTEELGAGIAGATKIWYDFNDFNAYLENRLTAFGHEMDDFKTTPIPEIMAYMDDWIREERI